MYKSVVYEGDKLLGEVEIYPQNHHHHQYLNKREKEIRISHFSTPSERCPPLAVLHTISSNGVSFKMESSRLQSADSPLNVLQSSCLRENKTAIVLIGEEEIHLVAMPSRKNGQWPQFWGFSVALGLYNSCLGMLNLRCLGIVFDLDETLIVANTMRSFEDRIEALQRKVSSEIDPQRVSGMLAEVKRYQDDKVILKQYAENDQVVDNGVLIKSQPEVFPALSDSHQPIIRPLIRLQDRNLILTRINPMIRDTSVLVRLRPAWEDLRSYLTAKGRKRFEVYVCTMAERDYALEMWRLLDPYSNLINPKELLSRIVCVKSGSRKSLFNVFQDGICHPKMALVIDDRLKVWDEKDQPRVHVVPAFAPYFAPQAEANNAVPVLCVARNVACNVRGGFFKDFDEGLLQRISEVVYEDDIKDTISTPDVSNYLISEEDASTLNGSKDSLGLNGMPDVEVERRLKDAISASSTVPRTVPNIDPRVVPHLQYAAPPSSLPVSQGPVVTFPTKQLPSVTSVLKPLTHAGLPETMLHTASVREEGEVPESELDPDTRRRLLILQHGQDTREHVTSEPQFPIRPPMPVTIPRVRARGSWFPVEEEMNPKQLNRMVPSREYPLHPEPVHTDNLLTHHPPFLHKVESPLPSARVFVESQRLPNELRQRDDRLKPNRALSYPSFSSEELSLSCSSSSNMDLDIEAGQVDPFAETTTIVGALQDIAFRCGSKVEFRPGLVSSAELQFFIEVWFAGEKIGEGVGRTRREAQHKAAEGSLMHLAERFLSRLMPDIDGAQEDGNKYSNAEMNGFIRDANSIGHQPLSKDEPLRFSTALEPSRIIDPRMDASKRSMGSIAELKELCMMEGLAVTFQPQPHHSASMGQSDEIYTQVEIDGQVWGKGFGLTWDEAMMQAADKALGSLKSTLGQFSHKRQVSPRSSHGMSTKRLRSEFPRAIHRMPSTSARYPKNASLVP